MVLRKAKHDFGYLNPVHHNIDSTVDAFYPTEKMDAYPFAGKQIITSVNLTISSAGKHFASVP